MRHRTTIERNAAVGEDDWNLPAAPDWQPHLEDLACYGFERTGRVVADGDKTVVIVDRRLLVPDDADVTERDRVRDVVEPGTGRLVLDGPMTVEARQVRRAHVELSLERVK